VYATPSAAYTFNDDLSAVQSMGIQIIGEEEISSILNLGYANVKLADFDFRLIYNTFAGFGVNLDDLSAVAVAVFDHGNAPPDISDRQFRFDYLDQRIRQENRLSAFAYFREDIPDIMTRLKAVAISAQNIDCPLIVMDTAPAAVLGTTFDRMVNNLPVLITNIGNFHTLAFRLSEKGIDGVFEHHTGLIDRPKLEKLLYALANSSLKHEDVFEDHGHGALVYNPAPMNLPKGKSECVVTGPRRSLMTGSTMNPYYAAPFGDMMMTGCFGLIAASADLLLEYKEEINNCLYGHSGIGTPLWELNE
jgi:uncharacterized protein (DUF1786 family)